MPRTLLLFPTAILFLFLCSQSFADTSPPLNWDASAELGFIKSAGNSETETLNAKFKAETSYTKWTHKLGLEALRSSSKDTATGNAKRSAEKYRIELQSDYALSDRSYAFGTANWENDNFSGLNYQSSVATGLGYKVIRKDTIKLNLEAAPGYRITEDDNNNKEEDAIIRLAEIFNWDISQSASLEQNLKVESGESNTEGRFGVGMNNQINGSLSMKVGYIITYNTDVGPGLKKTDRETAITLVYKL